MGWGIPSWLPLAMGIDSALKVSRLTPASRLPGRLPRSLGELQIANRGGPSWTSEVRVLLAQKVTPLALRAGPSYGILALFRSARGRLSLPPVFGSFRQSCRGGASSAPRALLGERRAPSLCSKDPEAGLGRLQPRFPARVSHFRSQTPSPGSKA